MFPKIDLADRRKGATAVMFGLMLPVIIGFAALAVDVSMVAVARNHLSTAADAAALAGAANLATENRVRGGTNLAAEIGAANSSAVTFAQKNAVLGAVPVLTANTSNATGGDIIVGYLDPSNPSSALDSSSLLASSFNSVQVKLHRDSSHGGKVPTVFAELMGFHGTSVQVTSTATAQAFSVTGFKAEGSASASLLPIVLDKPTWQKMMANATSDNFTYDTSTKSIKAGSDGITESKLYPVDGGLPGNWGTINVGVTSNSTSVLGDQIRNGITPSQLATFPNGTIQLDTSLSPPSIKFSGDPGISAGIKDDLAAIIGRPVAVPIYDTNGGNGNNAWYRVVAFQPARILSVNSQGNPKYVVIQPCIMNDPTAIRGTAQSWTSGGQIGLYLSR